MTRSDAPDDGRMRVALLAAPDSWYARDLARAAIGRCEVAFADFTRIRCEVAGDRCTVCAGEVNLSDCSAVLVRTMPPASLEQVVLRMDALAVLEASGAALLNPPKAIEAAVDKYLCSARLAAAGVATPRTIVCQDAQAAMEAFESLGGDVVLKPIFGAEGRGLARLNDADLLYRAAKLFAAGGSVLYLQEFVPHAGWDLRVLLLGDRWWCVRRRNPGDWRTNAARGATVERYDPSEELISLARTAAAAVGAVLAGVDLVQAPDGRWLVLEVNAVPGWKALAAACEVDIAGAVIDWVAALPPQVRSAHAKPNRADAPRIA